MKANFLLQYCKYLGRLSVGRQVVVSVGML